MTVMAAVQPPPGQIADTLLALYGMSFGGKKAGRYRISRKFLRQLSGRRKLSEDFIRGIADELFERECIFIDLESHFAVLEQRLFNSYRRVTAAAVAGIPPLETGPEPESRLAPHEKKKKSSQPPSD